MTTSSAKDLGKKLDELMSMRGAPKRSRPRPRNSRDQPKVYARGDFVWACYNGEWFEGEIQAAEEGGTYTVYYHEYDDSVAGTPLWLIKDFAEGDASPPADGPNQLWSAAPAARGKTRDEVKDVGKDEEEAELSDPFESQAIHRVKRPPRRSSEPERKHGGPASSGSDHAGAFVVSPCTLTTSTGSSRKGSAIGGARPPPLPVGRSESRFEPATAAAFRAAAPSPPSSQPAGAQPPSRETSARRYQPASTDMGRAPWRPSSPPPPSAPASRASSPLPTSSSAASAAASSAASAPSSPPCSSPQGLRRCETMGEVSQRLFVGGASAAADGALLAAHGITHVVDLSNRIAGGDDDDGGGEGSAYASKGSGANGAGNVSVFMVVWPAGGGGDGGSRGGEGGVSPAQALLGPQQRNGINGFVQHALASGGAVLVHCGDGNGASCATAIQYVLEQQKPTIHSPKGNRRKRQAPVLIWFSRRPAPPLPLSPPSVGFLWPLRAAA